ncbi:BatD family protein [Shewanella salipaludis]|uniref:Protein BatD n=1 Tax=Shewanella salipaludis TaxID=2723052 RepID=A0A972JKB7_9GAMM|nr:protein BatD [Shewanella salipaludis]
MVIRQFFILLLMVLLAPSQALAMSKLEASVDRNPVMEGEYLVLNIRADDELDAGKLDTASLLKDFIVGRTSVSRSTQIMNFDASKETRWQILLSPKRSGKLMIPAFKIDGVSSNAIPLNVVAKGSQAPQTKDLFIETSVSSDEAYVGQLITYRVKLYLAVELQRGVLSAPVLEGAQIKQIGEDKDGSEIVDGRRFRVIERTYGIIPDMPGELSIGGASFSGDVLVESQRRGSMFGFNESRPMQTKSPTKTLQIEPTEAGFQGKWLVADLVLLKEDWPETEDKFEVGSPITRTITLLASNADENSLPEITAPLPAEFKSYPEKPQRQTFVRNAQVVSQYSITSALVPTKAGTYTLPEVRVPWWNPHLKRQEFASLPARTVTVAAGQAVAAVPLQGQVESGSAGFWPWVSLAFALLWLTTLVLWRKALANQKQASSAAEAKPARAPKPDSHRQLLDACKRADAGQILSRLQTHMSRLHGQSMTLEEIAALSADFAKAIKQLQSAAYGKSPKALDSAALLGALASYSPHSRNRPLSALNELNP